MNRIIIKINKWTYKDCLIDAEIAATRETVPATHRTDPSSLSSFSVWWGIHRSSAPPHLKHTRIHLSPAWTCCLLDFVTIQKHWSSFEASVSWNWNRNHRIIMKVVMTFGQLRTILSSIPAHIPEHFFVWHRKAKFVFIAWQQCPVHFAFFLHLQ